MNFYFDEFRDIIKQELINQELFTDTVNIAPLYLDKETGELNNEGREIYTEILIDQMREYFSRMYYLDNVKYGQSMYTLYFSIAGFDDLEFFIVKSDISTWPGSLSIPKDRNNDNSIIFNYDEGPKNSEGVRLISFGHLLVMSRGGLYHSLYDMKNLRVLINNESPWYQCNCDTEEQLDQWILDNLHDPIEKKISELKGGNK